MLESSIGLFCEPWSDLFFLLCHVNEWFSLALWLVILYLLWCKGEVFFLFCENMWKGLVDIFEKGTTSKSCCLKNKGRYLYLHIIIAPIKIKAAVKFHSTWFNMIGFLRYIVGSAYNQWQNCWDLNGEMVKCCLEKEWRDSILITLSLPMQIWSGKCFWFMAGWSKFLSWYDLFWKSYIYYTDLGSDMLTVRNFSAHSTDIILWKTSGSLVEYHPFSSG